jgi:uncharacterized protein (DUF885 family)
LFWPNICSQQKQTLPIQLVWCLRRALYTESLGKELGLYQDPYQYWYGNNAPSGSISSWYRIHAKGWTRESYPVFFNEAESEAYYPEIERYMAIPGQALSYKLVS